MVKKMAERKIKSSKKKIGVKLTKAVKKLKVKASDVINLAKVVQEAENTKPYKVLKQNDGQEVRIYQPTKRTVLASVGNDPHHFLQFPYIVLAYQPHGKGGYLYGCFATEDLSQMTEEERKKAIVYRMPFPAQLDRGMWGPCCLISGPPWYYIEKDFNGLIEQFWSSVFLDLGNYGQKCVSCWKDMPLDDVYSMLKKSTPPYKGTYEQFMTAVDLGPRDY